MAKKKQLKVGDRVQVSIRRQFEGTVIDADGRWFEVETGVDETLTLNRDRGRWIPPAELLQLSFFNEQVSVAKVAETVRTVPIEVEA